MWGEWGGKVEKIAAFVSALCVVEHVSVYVAEHSTVYATFVIL